VYVGPTRGGATGEGATDWLWNEDMPGGGPWRVRMRPPPIDPRRLEDTILIRIPAATITKKIQELCPPTPFP
jgi:hypothetical protein